MPERDRIIGIDAGTSVIKAVVFDLHGNELALAARPNVYVTLPGGGVEQELERTWIDTAAVLAELTERLPDLASRLLVVAVTGQGDGTWLVDREGEPVAPGWLWLDSRAAGIVQELAADGTRERAYRITGCGLNPCNSSSQLLWMKRHRPDLLARAATAFHTKDWLYLKLTGVTATDISEASFTFGDYRTRAYSEELIELLGLREERRLLPQALDGSRVTHGLSEQAARATGLLAGTPVSLGFVDIICTALGGGLYEEGQHLGMTVVGSTGMHMQLFKDADAVELGPEASGYVIPFPIPGHVARLQTNMSGTLNIDWLVRLAADAGDLMGHAPERRDLLHRIDAAVLDATPGACLYHPYIHAAGERGPFLDSNARAMLTGLTAEVGLIDLMRGVYEGLAFAARDCHAATGDLPDEIRVAGGASRSRALKIILASVLNRPMRESTRGEAGAAGAAMMAALAMGVFPDMAATARHWVTPCLGGRVLPVPELTALYKSLFEVYVTTRRAMAPLWQQLAAIRAQAAPQPVEAAALSSLRRAVGQ